MEASSFKIDSGPIPAIGGENRGRSPPSVISIHSDDSSSSKQMNRDNIQKREHTESASNDSSFTVSSNDSSHSSDSEYHDHPNPKRKSSRKKRKLNVSRHFINQKRRAKNSKPILWDLKDENISLSISSIEQPLNTVTTMGKEAMTAFTESSESLKSNPVPSFDSLFAVEDSLKVVENRVNGMNELEGKLMSVQAELRAEKFGKILQTKLLNNQMIHIDRSLTKIADIRSKIHQIRMQSHQINIQLKMEKKKQCKNMLMEINKELNLSTARGNKATKKSQDGTVESSMCIICEENVNDMVCVPCGHRYSCQKCVEERGQLKQCDVCQSEVTMVIRTYNSGSTE